METIPTTSRSLDRYYHINGDTFEKQYKEVLSGYREWSELSHAEDWLVFPENIGESLCIDETAPSNGELYTIVSNRSSRGGKGTIVAIAKGVAADAVTKAVMRIGEDKRQIVKEMTMDMSNSMQLIARRCFPNAMRTIDRFHIQKLTYDALFEEGIQLVTGFRVNMKNKLMPFCDKMMLRKRYNIETINDLLKNTAQIVRSRHRSVTNFIMNLNSALGAYSFFDNKPTALVGYSIEDTRQLSLF